jgi:peptidylprolyl isomerase
MKTTAERGDRVRVECLRLCDRAESEMPRRQRTLEFTVGGRGVIAGISRGVVGMSPGDFKQLTIQPRDGFGAVRRRLIRSVPRTRFPADVELHIGKRLTCVGATSGRRRRVKVIGMNPDAVIVDANHPLAGKAFDVEIHLVALDSFCTDHDDLQPSA